MRICKFPIAFSLFLKTTKAFITFLSFFIFVGCQDPKNPRVTGEAPPPPTYPIQIQEPPPEVKDILLPEAAPLPTPSTILRSNTPPPKPQPNSIHRQQGNLQGNGPVKMDILFVIDTSESMRCDQENLSKNINQFVKQIKRNDKIDFHIGVTAAWDSKSYGEVPRKFKNGELRPISSRSKQRFVTKSNSALLSSALKLGVEPLRYLSGFSGPKDPQTTGPEFEELFSPVLAAFSNEMLEGPNQGFRRPDAQLAIIIITDTGDLTPDPMNTNRILVAEQVRESLLALVTEQANKQENSLLSSNLNVTVSAALARLDEWMQFSENKTPGNALWMQNYAPNRKDGCLRVAKTKSGKTVSKFELNKVDPDIAGPYGRPPEKSQIDMSYNPESLNSSPQERSALDFKLQLEGPKQIYELTKLTEGEAFDLQSNDFGKKLASLGSNLFKKSVNFQITLERPLYVGGSVEIKVNGMKLKNSDWSWDPDRNIIKLHEDAEVFDSKSKTNKKLSELENFDYSLKFTVLD
jgi:hypothetical protein